MRISILLLATLISVPAIALEVPEFLKCSNLNENEKRLECFDGLADNLKDKEKAKSERETFDNWNVSISKSPIDDSETVVLNVPAENEVRGRFRDTSRPVLILRCMENTTSAYINFDGHHMADIQGYGDITFRVDKRKAFTRGTDVSTDNSSLGLWSGGRAIPFIKNLLGGDSLLIQATPFSESPITVRFDISNLDEAIIPLRKACSW